MLAYILLFWLLATVFSHLCLKCGRASRKVDRFGLIPVWRYFVANVGRKEFYIVGKSDEANGASATVILPDHRNGRLISGVWSLDSRNAKAGFDTLFMAVENENAMARRVLIAVAREIDRDTVGSTDCWVVFRKDNLDGTTTNLGELLP